MIHAELQKRDEQIDMLFRVIAVLINEIDTCNDNQYLDRHLVKELGIPPEMANKLNLYDESKYK